MCTIVLGVFNCVGGCAHDSIRCVFNCVGGVCTSVLGVCFTIGVHYFVSSLLGMCCCMECCTMSGDEPLSVCRLYAGCLRWVCMCSFLAVCYCFVLGFSLLALWGVCPQPGNSCFFDVIAWCVCSWLGCRTCRL